MEMIIAFIFHGLPSWILWCHCIALLFQTKEPQLSNNRGNAVMSWNPRWQHAGNFKSGNLFRLLLLLSGGTHELRSEIWSIIKRELLGLKCVGNTSRQLTTPNESLRLVGDWYLSTNSSLQFSIFQIHQIFNISYFFQFNLSFEKKNLFPKMPKNHPQIYGFISRFCFDIIFMN